MPGRDAEAGSEHAAIERHAWGEFLRVWRCGACGEVAPYDYIVCACGAGERQASYLTGRGTVWAATRIQGDGVRRVVMLVTSAENPDVRFLAAHRGEHIPSPGAPVKLIADCGRPEGEAMPVVAQAEAG